MKKRLGTLLLAAVMVITVLPASALTAQAEETAWPGETVSEEIVAEETDAVEPAAEEENPALPAQADEADAEEPVFTEQATTIQEVTLVGVHVPTAGAAAAASGITVTSLSHCTINEIYWFDVLAGSEMSSTATFQTGRSYELRVNFVPNSGYAFADPENLTITLSGIYSSDIYGITKGKSGGGTYPNRYADISFNVVGGGRITSVYLNGIDAPALGAHPQTFTGYSYAPGTGMGGLMQWRCVETNRVLTTSDTFEYGFTYRFEAAFVAKSGFLFAGVNQITASWNGSTSVFEDVNMQIDADYTNMYGKPGLRVYYTFPRVGGPFTTVYSPYIKYLSVPYPGERVSEHLDLVELSSEHYSVSVSRWRDYSSGKTGETMAGSDTFRPGGVYQLELVLTPDQGYWFANVGNMGLTIENIPSGRFSYRYEEYNTAYPTGPTRPDKRVVYITFRMPDAFTDVTDESAFYYKPVYWAAAEGITTGWDDGTFRPWKTCNRAAVIAFLWRLAGSPLQHANDKPVFDDVDGSIGGDFYPAIMWGYGEGIIQGFSDGTFRPWNTCNRAAIVTFLYRYAKLQNGGDDVLPEGAYNNPSNRFPDMTGNEEFDRAIIWAYWGGVATGFDDGTFRPWNNCNRASVVSFIYRMDRTMGMAG